MKANAIQTEKAHEAIRAAVLDVATFQRALYSDPGKNPAHPWRRIQIRPVMLKAGYHWQVSRFDAKKDLTKNYDVASIGPVLDELWTLGFRNLVVEGGARTLTGTRTGVGYRVVEKACDAPQPVVPEAHDRKKAGVLDPDQPAPFLGMLGFVTPEGRLKADKRDKFTQINEFLRILDETGAFPARGEPFSVVDFGCGNAYLTFALYHRLVNDFGVRAKITGVDLKDELMRLHTERAAVLGWPDLSFETGTIQAYQAGGPPDAVVALHACDTATDDAIAQGIAWGSRLIVVAPCCHHNLQTQLDRVPPKLAFAPVFRYGLTSERQADLLTDAFRALLLRIKGYRTDVIQFVDPSNTPKNLMIRAVKTATPAPASFLEEYRAMKEFWGVVPYLEGKILPLE
jgi:SAM-dependent methyltransferase